MLSISLLNSHSLSLNICLDGEFDHHVPFRVEFIFYVNNITDRTRIIIQATDALESALFLSSRALLVQSFHLESVVFFVNRG